MKTFVVQLERDDDVVSARDKMLWSKAPRILIVWPRRGRVLNRELDIILLKRQSQKLGAQLAFVSFDDDVILYASESEIPCYSSVSQAQRNIWKTSRRDEKIYERPHRKWSLLELRAWLKQSREPVAMTAPLRIGSFAVGVIAVLVLGLFLLPGATVIVQPEAGVQTVQMAVQANPDVTIPTLAGVIPLYDTTVIVEGQDQIPASGALKLSDTYAAGEVSLINLTDKKLTVAEGTVVLTTDEPAVRFRTMKDVNLLAGEENAEIVQIQAVIPGSTGNVAKETILAVEGEAGLALRVTNLEPTAGGEDRNVPTPTEQDLRRVNDRLLNSLQESAIMDIERMLGDSGILIVDSLKVVETVSQRQEPQLGEPGDVLTLTLQVEYTAHYIEKVDLQQVTQMAMDASLEGGKTPVEGTLVIADVYQTNTGEAISEWQVVAARNVYQEWQQDAVIRSLLGVRPEDVDGVLSTEFNLEAPAEVTMQPFWWPRLPYLPLRIQLEVQ